MDDALLYEEMKKKSNAGCHQPLLTGRRQDTVIASGI